MSMNAFDNENETSCALLNGEMSVFAVAYFHLVKEVADSFVSHVCIARNAMDYSLAEWPGLAVCRREHCRTVHSGPRVRGDVRKVAQYQQVSGPGWLAENGYLTITARTVHSHSASSREEVR
jgi:hypothetical protein